MNFIEQDKAENSSYPRVENSPYMQLLMLLAYSILGLIVFTFIGLAVVFGIYGTSALQDVMMTGDGKSVNIEVLQVILISSSLGAFLAPAILLSITEGKKLSVFYGFRKPDIKLLAIVFLIMVVSMPVMEWTASINQKMNLPDSLKSIEDWIKEKEDDAMQTTMLLLTMHSIKQLLMNLFMIALLPAVVEELMFRGGVQRTFSRLFKNPHAAIWTAAFIFSAIHMQFYGFLPRLLLGAGFGYIYYYSGNLWYAMLGHFLNNAYAVCAAWYMQKNNIPLSATESTINISWYGYVISLVLTVVTFIYFKNTTNNLRHERRMD